MEMERVTHTFAPIYDENSRVLMLGTMPSRNPGKWGFTTDTRATASGKSCPISAAKNIQVQQKKKLHLHFEITLPCGMCWLVVKSAAQRTTASVIRCLTTWESFLTMQISVRFLPPEPRRPRFIRSTAIPGPASGFIGCLRPARQTAGCHMKN